MIHKITCSFLEFNFSNLPLLVEGIEVKNCSVKYAVSLQIIALRKVAVSSVLIWVYRAVAFFFLTNNTAATTKPKLTSSWVKLGYCSCKQDAKERYWGQQFVKWKEHFGPTDRNDQTGQRGPPSKLIRDIPVGLKQDDPFHLMYQPKFPEFWLNGLRPSSRCYSKLSPQTLYRPD